MSSATKRPPPRTWDYGAPVLKPTFKQRQLYRRVVVEAGLAGLWPMPLSRQAMTEHIGFLKEMKTDPRRKAALLATQASRKCRFHLQEHHGIHPLPTRKNFTYADALHLLKEHGRT